MDRRNFFKTIGAVGLGTVLASTEAKADSNQSSAIVKTQEPKFPQVPKRILGKTGIKVPCLSLGMPFNVMQRQALLENAIQWGVSYWDTTNGYAGGNSELGIGKFLLKNPEAREQLFIVTSGARSAADAENYLQTSLKRMNTKYIDLYHCAYMVSDPATQLTDELKQWAESAKKRKLIRFVGFTTHKNMAQCLEAAAKLDWIDAVMTSYNFRLMQDQKLQAAIEACHKAGVGLIAMKTQAFGHWGWEKVGAEEERELVRRFLHHFIQTGLTEGQAKIKVVLENKRFATACVGVSSVALLTSNAAVALDKTKLTQTDRKIFKEYAAASCSGYCAGCADICDAVLPDTPYVSDIMRYLMYCNSYGQQNRAKRLFAQIPYNIRNKLLAIDYSAAEARCPQRLPIADLIAEAVTKLVKRA